MDIRESVKELEGYKGTPIKDLTHLRHVFMKEYGWISEVEFYCESSLSEAMKLSHYIYEDKMAEKKELDNIKSKGKR